MGAPHTRLHLWECGWVLLESHTAPAGPTAAQGGGPFGTEAGKGRLRAAPNTLQEVVFLDHRFQEVGDWEPGSSHLAHLAPVTTQASYVWSAKPEFSMRPSPSVSNFSSESITVCGRQRRRCLRGPWVAGSPHHRHASPHPIAYLTDRPHVPQECRLLREGVVPVDLQHELQVEVLPGCRVVDQVGVDSLPWLVIWQERAREGWQARFPAGLHPPQLARGPAMPLGSRGSKPKEKPHVPSRTKASTTTTTRPKLPRES